MYQKVASFPGLSSQAYRPRLIVPGLLSQAYCPRLIVPGLSSQAYRPRLIVPGLSSQAYRPRLLSLASDKSVGTRLRGLRTTDYGKHYGRTETLATCIQEC